MVMALTLMLMMIAEVVRVAVDEGEGEDAAVLVRMLMAVVLVKESTEPTARTPCIGSFGADARSCPPHSVHMLLRRRCGSGGFGGGRGYARTMRRAGALLPAVVAGLAGPRRAMLRAAAPGGHPPAHGADGVGRTRFGSARHQQLLSMRTDRRQQRRGSSPSGRERCSMTKRSRRRPKATCKTTSMLVSSGVRSAWRKRATWLDPGLLDSIDFRDRPYTAGHHPVDENITNNTTQMDTSEPLRADRPLRACPASSRSQNFRTNSS